jgi:hypothetical protein
MCVPRPLEVKGKGIRGVGRGSRFGSMYCPYYEHYFPAAVLCSSLSQFLCRNVFGLHSTGVCFPFYPQASDVGETQRLLYSISRRH